MNPAKSNAPHLFHLPLAPIFQGDHHQRLVFGSTPIIVRG